ncbi:MAG: hypothetical protein PHI02_06525 [Sulfurovaceae bacterium]|nr:hypothetical protein [Sulfurovaceae bacterium]
MKKALLLSMIASTMIMAGGDIAPVESAAVTPAPVAESGWKFSGQAVGYYQALGLDIANVDLFDQELASANAGLQLTATNDNLIGGVGFGVQLNGLGTLGLEEDVVAYPMQQGNSLNSAYISQLYLTYGIGNTSLKVGRQELPKALSPFAFSEDWNVFKNTFDAALVVNNDIPNTTVALAWVKRANYNDSAVMADNYNGFSGITGMNEFNSINDNDGAFMLTAQNKSIDNVILTGSYYNVSTNTNGDYILWADAQINVGNLNIGLQGGKAEEGANAYGAKVATTISDVNLALAYSNVGGHGGFKQLGGTTSPLYTDMAGDQLLGSYDLRYATSEKDAKKWMISANKDIFGGNLSAVYGMIDAYYADSYKEFDIAYSKNISDNLNLSAAYVHADADYLDGFPTNNPTIDVVRVIGRYNF